MLMWRTGSVLMSAQSRASTLWDVVHNTMLCNGPLRKTLAKTNNCPEVQYYHLLYCKGINVVVQDYFASTATGEHAV